jgi:hypothetical protein
MRYLSTLAVALSLACGGPSDPAPAFPGVAAAPLLQPLVVQQEPSPSPRLLAAEVGGRAGADTASVGFDASGAQTLLVVSAAVAGETEYLLERRNSDGERVWALAWAGQAGVSDALGAVAPGGEVFIVRSGATPQGPVSVLAKLGATGALLWQSGIAPRAERVFPLPDGGAIVAARLGSGAHTVWRVGPDGQAAAPPLAGWPTGDVLRAVSPAGDLFVGTTAGTLVKRGLAGGAPQWSVDLRAPGGAGLAAILARVDGGATAFVRDECLVYDSAGILLPSARVPPPARGITTAQVWAGSFHAAAAPEGEIGLVTRFEVPGAGAFFFVQLLDEGGRVIWTTSLGPFTPGAGLFPASVTFDAQSRLAIAGSFGPMSFLGQPLAPQGATDAFLLRFQR